MGWRGWTVVLLALAALAPGAGPASADPACVASGASTRLLQSDAGLPGDAPDDAAAPRALAFPEPADGEQGAYYWAWLDPPLGRGGEDGHDWFTFHLSPGEKRVMVNVTSNYTAGMHPYDAFLLELWRGPAVGEPDGVTVSGGETLDLADAAGGAWTIHVTALAPLVGSAPACADLAAPGATDLPVQRDYGAYVGCNPICATAR